MGFDDGAAVPYTDWFSGTPGFILWAPHLSLSLVSTQRSLRTVVSGLFSEDWGMGMLELI